MQLGTVETYTSPKKKGIETFRPVEQFRKKNLNKPKLGVYISFIFFIILSNSIVKGHTKIQVKIRDSSLLLEGVKRILK